ncbi:MAG: hypothetical protein RL276_243 [Bacteroidota bacterium]|jgi:hypothetical protein
MSLLLENFTSPALLFFLLGIAAALIRSDLELPPTSSKFISIYLLLSIGFRGGQELAHETLRPDSTAVFGLALASSMLVPVYVFWLARRSLGVANAGAVAAAYGSVSAVTFVAAGTFLERMGLHLPGYLVAVMAFMEAPAIVVGLWLARRAGASGGTGSWLRHALTNGSVVLVLGSLLVGFVTDDAQAEGIRPFTNDLFKGFLAVFLLDMGLSSGRNLKALWGAGWQPFALALLLPLVNGTLMALLSSVTGAPAEARFMLSVLAASASYIAVPAAMRIALPEANPGIYLPMALALTFPVNMTLGIPWYYWLVS